MGAPLREIKDILIFTKIKLFQVFASFLLGTLAEYDQNMALYSIFTGVNGVLGGMIFFFHCTANEKIRQKITNVKNKLCRKKDN